MRAVRWALLGVSLGVAPVAWAAADTSGTTTGSDPLGTNQSSSTLDPEREDAPSQTTPGTSGTDGDSGSGAPQRFEGSSSGGSNSGIGTTPDSGGGEDESEMGGAAPESSGGGTAPGATTPGPVPR